MRLGKLDRRVAVQRPMKTRNTYGEDITSWMTIFYIWCEFKQYTGSERFVSQQYVGQVDALFITHYDRSINPLDRLVYEGREYDILAVLEIGRREGISINARARSENAST